jgi:hypothetical protein
MSDWICTASGKKFFPMEPNPADICIEDIAHALSHLCRFTGHTREFYSVAEHSVRVSRAALPADALWGLLHDASEAYLCDVASPVKRHHSFAPYRAIERRVQNSICRRFGLPLEMPDSVHSADNVLLWTEKRDLMPPCASDDRGTTPITPLVFRIEPWDSKTAQFMFLQEFSWLTEDVA